MTRGQTGRSEEEGHAHGAEDRQHDDGVAAPVHVWHPEAFPQVPALREGGKEGRNR